MPKPRLLDLYCGLGGAAVGYSAAGFDVVGVDLSPQPDYPFEFIRGDAIEFVYTEGVADFDAIHASPPCAAYTAIGIQNAARGVGKDHPRLYDSTKVALLDAGLPFVIENPAARPDVVLCGEMFGLGVLRHRRFETGYWKMLQPAHRKHRGRVRGWRHGEYHDGPYVAVYGSGGGKASLAEAQQAMAITWTDDLAGIVQAIPPAYTACVGMYLQAWMAHPVSEVGS